MNLNDVREYAKRVIGVNSDTGKHLITKVSGVSFDEKKYLLNIINEDTKVKLERDKNNPHDSFAVKVMVFISNNWHHVGFIPKIISKKVSDDIEKGCNLVACVLKVTGFDNVKGLLLKIEGVL
jgi:hypothetical protein